MVTLALCGDVLDVLSRVPPDARIPNQKTSMTVEILPIEHDSFRFYRLES